MKFPRLINCSMIASRVLGVYKKGLDSKFWLYYNKKQGFIMNTATLSNEYQLVIPQEIRETNGLKAGTSFEVMSYKNRIELIPIKPMRDLRGIFRGIDTTIIRDDDRL